MLRRAAPIADMRPGRASGSEVATLINDYINRGAIVPVEITIGLLEKARSRPCQPRRRRAGDAEERAQRLSD